MKRTAVASLILFLPVAVLADITGTVTLSANTVLNLDTGAIVTSGGDLVWNGSTLAPHGTARALNATTVFGESGTTGYATVSQQVLQTLMPSLGSNLPLTSLATNNVIGVQTNGSNYAKLLVTAVGGGSISLQYTTYGVGSSTPPPPPPTSPTITQLQNNYSYILPTLPNYGIAPGTLFIIQGTNLANTTNAVLQSSSGSGLPLSLNGASISVSVNGVTTHPGIYYAIATQIAAVLPSSTPVGNGTITVTYNGTPSASFAINVTQSALGLDSYNGTGSGLGVVTDAVTGSLFSYTQSAKPGQTVVLWGSGLGADTADSDLVATSTPHAVNVPLTIYIGGVQAPILYQGGSGYPGVNQLNVTIPASVITGCYVPIIAVSGSYTSNSVTIPVDPSGGACSDSFLTAGGVSFAGVASKTNIVAGSLIVNQVNGGNFGGAVFESAQNAFLYASAITAGSSLGGCAVSSAAVKSISVPTPPGPDAGTITLTGPTGSVPVTPFPSANGGSSGVYSTTALPAAFIPSTGATFTMKGSGGKDVGPFTTSISYPSLLNWTNKGSLASIPRTQALNFTWTGAPAGSYLFLEGYAQTPTAGALFTCTVAADPGQFTVPPYILQALPPGTGSLSMTAIEYLAPFTATGLDIGIAEFTVGLNITPTFN
jgi:uncharacterized protein (TIGR03437 family)